MSFQSDIANFAEKTERLASQVIRKTALDVYTRIVMRTPVDTGRARGNWMLSTGQPITGTTEEKSQGPRPVEIGKLSDYSAKNETPIWLVNNLGYVVQLENGHSKQAPRGMVAITVAEFQRIVGIIVEWSRG